MNGVLASIIGIAILVLLLWALWTARKRASFTMSPRVLMLTITGLFAATSLWLVVGAHINPERVGWIFFGVNLFSFVYTAIEPQVRTAFEQRVMTSTAVLHGRELLLQCMVRIIMGVAIIILSGFTGFTIAVPQVTFSVAGDGFLQALTTTVIAPFSEEPFFLVVIPSMLTLIFMALFGNRTFALGASLVVSSVVFSMFHWYAYGANLSLAVGAFTGAAIFRLLMLSVELVKEKDFTVPDGAAVLAITIPAHAVFNTYIWAGPLVITGGGP